MILAQNWPKTAKSLWQCPFNMTSLPVHTAIHPVCSCGCQQTENPGTYENQGLFDCHEGCKKCSSCSYSMAYFLKCYHFYLMRIILIITAADAVWSISGRQMKTEPVMTSFIEKTTSPKMADQNDDFIVEENCKSLSDFQKFQLDEKWSECRELIEN